MNYEDDFERRLIENAVNSMRLAREYQAMRQNAPPHSAEAATEFDIDNSPAVLELEQMVADMNIENAKQNKSNAKKLPNLSKEEEEIMQLNKGMRKRADGRYEWRQTVCGIHHFLIHPNVRELARQVREYKIKHFGGATGKPVPPKEQNKLFDLCKAYFERYIKNDDTPSSKNYQSVLNKYLGALTKSITAYGKDDIVDFLAGMKSKRQAKQCFYLLRRTFADAEDKQIIKRNIMLKVPTPKAKSEIGKWFDIEEQRLIYQNRHTSPIGDEIEFYILTGCRLREAFSCAPDFKNNKIYVNRTKRDGTSGYVKISARYRTYLEEHWGEMFKQKPDYYTRELSKFLTLLKIKRQPNEKPVHRLRHTFATNIYYFGVPDKQRSYLMGHKKTEITNDIYTTYDPDIKRADIDVIYGDLYPEF